MYHSKCVISVTTGDGFWIVNLFIYNPKSKRKCYRNTSVIWPLVGFSFLSNGFCLLKDN